jgi:3',5'-cyclic-nucleotide phosphodiesterase
LKWAKLIVEEFCQQGDKEKSLGMNCSFDRKKLILNLFQISFIDYIIEPFFALLVTIFPNLKFLHDNAKDNKDKFLNYSTKTNDEEKNQSVKK